MENNNGLIKRDIGDLCEDYFLDWLEGGPQERAEVIKKLKPNQYIILAELPAKEMNTSQFNKAINYLKKVGLDIGKGDAEFGYKMPLPKKEEESRELRIFRRR